MDIEVAGIIVAVTVPLSALLVWSMRAIVAPLGVVIENNTKAMDRIMETITLHGEKLEDHGIRIACIETRDEVEARK